MPGLKIGRVVSGDLSSRSSVAVATSNEDVCGKNRFLVNVNECVSIADHYEFHRHIFLPDNLNYPPRVMEIALLGN